MMYDVKGLRCLLPSLPETSWALAGETDFVSILPSGVMECRRCGGCVGVSPWCVVLAGGLLACCEFHRGVFRCLPLEAS